MNLNLYEVKLPKDKDGWCAGGGLLCGYCGACLYLYKLGKANGNWDDITEWRRDNYIFHTKYTESKYKLENEAKLEAVDDIKYWAFKVGFPPGFCPKKAFKLVSLATSSHGWDNGIWNIEFFSKTHPDGGNLHFHLLQPRLTKYKKGALIKHLSKVCGIKENFIEWSKDGASFAQQVNYICGIKKEEKMIYVEKDREWRSDLGFPHISHNFPKILRNKYKKQIEYALRE